MSDIFVPISLNAADSALLLADSLAKLLDPKERAKIADDIKAHHILNNSEAKKHADALGLIKQHQIILDETNRVSKKNDEDAKTLEQNKKQFEVYCTEERQKISNKWSDVNTASETAKNLHTKAENMISSVAAREEELRKAKEVHVIEVKKVEDKNKVAEEIFKKAEEIKKQHTELLESIKAKQAAIAAFNL